MQDAIRDSWFEERNRPRLTQIKSKYPQKEQTEHLFRKAPRYFQWDVIPGACIPYIKQHFGSRVSLCVTFCLSPHTLDVCPPLRSGCLSLTWTWWTLWLWWSWRNVLQWRCTRLDYGVTVQRKQMIQAKCVSHKYCRKHLLNLVGSIMSKNK